MTERAGEAIEGTGKALKRRGILAAAGAVVAGMVAKQASQPVAAGTDHQPLVIAESNTGSSGTALTYTGPTASSGAVFTVGDGGAANVNAGTAVIAGIATAGKVEIGVYGESTSGPGVEGRSAFFYGVFGRSDRHHGVYGATNAPVNSGKAGVYGNGFGDGTYGVYGDGNTGSGVGVRGVSDSAAGVGVNGTSVNGTAIVAQTSGAANANAAVLGVATKGPGVQGQSTGYYGLVGFTNATDGHSALIGYANAAGGIGIIGNAPGGASPGLAGVFNGDVAINGALRVYGSPKSAAVKHPDNTYRLLYCMESPESWFEDFGEGTLVNGKAEIRLDPDFAALVHTDKYHVFLTEYDGHSGLYVTGKGPAGFTVQADGAASGPKAPTKAGAGTFSYRVVAKRKDIGGERLAKVAPPPPLKPVEAFVVPETPEAKPPAKKP